MRVFGVGYKGDLTGFCLFDLGEPRDLDIFVTLHIASGHGGDQERSHFHYQVVFNSYIAVQAIHGEARTGCYYT